MLTAPHMALQATVHGSPNLVYINVSPIEYGHVLLVPRVMDCLPQVCAALDRQGHTLCRQ
jgi:hypothetical protein